jgi:hypothetical protein
MAATVAAFAARMAIIDISFGHTGPFYCVPLSSYFRA